ncbi:FAD-dependent oxidoreductase [Halalkalibacterium halodurans]|nr:FAD-dependent oxidoreductase [Halalkalibacterium halodurans]MED4086754.1 FAD-dependent oxidoreductase [Halalkalibacterium halodurans]MED4104916.1 FAD-dependent oxidoreductase [Halalkalibacterium halodurans]MED4110416.1 FAD-dependent oxidoreductase [Halalkalibacterium halodurans]MED4124198.1 FAD-dependent oxidoreductase [Halalkalibacterium halodurans]
MKGQSKKALTKKRIEEASLSLFREQGYDSTTVQEITAKAQVAKGTFFNYFPTKESIMRSLAEDRLHSVSVYMEQRHIQSLPILKKIRTYLSYLLEEYDSHPKLTVQIWRHVVEFEEMILSHWVVLLEEAKERGELSEDFPIHVWSHIIHSHVCYGLQMSHLAPTKAQLLAKVMPLLEESLSAIIQKRGNSAMKKLVVLGGGYGGMRILQRLLPNDLPSDWEITLVDRLPYHCLKTEYYALAAGTASDHHLRVSFPEDPRLSTRYGSVASIDLASKTVLFEEGEPLTYDTLIIGLGCEDKYHGVPGAKEHTYSIQSMEATRRTYEALNNVRPEGVVTIVGAGLSGVELASELRESRPDLTIKLLDRGDIILSMFPRRLSNYVQNWFIDHGVDIINKSNVTKVEEGAVYNHDERIESDAIIWTAGIQPNVVVRNLDVEKDQQGRVVLTPHHHLPTDEDVFVVGDCASLPHAPSAQLAEGQAEQIVTVLKKRWNNESLPDEFPRIKLKGVLGSLGKKHGFGLMGERTLIGRVPRVLKSGVLWMYKYHSG